MRLGALLLDLLRVDPSDVHVDTVGDAPVCEALDDALVGVVQVHVFAAHRDLDRLRHRVDLLDHLLPLDEVGGRTDEIELLADNVVEPFLAELERHLVDRGHVARLDHLANIDVAEERDLPADVVVQRPLGAAYENVRLNPDLEERLDAVLRGLGLELAGRLDVRHEREVNIEAVLASVVEAKLANGLEEREPLDVAGRPADLRDDDVDVGAVLGREADARLDLVRDVGNDLHGAPEVGPFALAVDDRLVDLAGRNVGALAQVVVDEALVVPEIEIGLGAVVRDVDLAVLERAHRARVDVQVRIEFLENDVQSALLEEESDGGAGDAFAERGNDPSRHENVFRLPAHSVLVCRNAFDMRESNTAHHSSGCVSFFQLFFCAQPACGEVFFEFV